jgi:hypothetical protein
LALVLRRDSSLQFDEGGIRMNRKLLNCLAAGALGTALALAAPAFARGGFGGGMGGMHGGGMGGMGRAMPVGAMGGGMRFSAASPQFNGARFANARFANAAISPRFASSAFHHGFHHRFFHHRFNRFAFFGGPFVYAAYDSCWSQVWTAYGPQWVNVCANYGY